MVQATGRDPAAQGAARYAASRGGGRETARRARTRERLMDAAYRVFSEQGINGAAIEAITDEAGFTRGAFYSNFASKTELFFALTERENRTRLETLRQRFDSVIEPLGRARDKPSREFFEEMVADLLSTQPDTRQWCLMLGEFRLLAMRDPEVAPRFLESARTFRQQLAELTEATARSVGLRFVIDPVHLTRLLIDQYESAMEEAILSGAADPESATRETIMHTLPTLLHSLTDVVDSSEA
ncbi:TetR/AcrR family transcriptional regulator [Haloactinomyces albus]|uniref:AcrR family transcriptional regulator n=1 Tax=Haloactinomyces albus TaxID=1352928 RepID=A0AAE4CP13_9ACTN|nr:TetR family transcriptional regulator [Haloactinomyces albus]MDR7301243.1 AcrR family transcriptional regulator [Haloactinomyces albus]